MKNGRNQKLFMYEHAALFDGRLYLTTVNHSVLLKYLGDLCKIPNVSVYVDDHRECLQKVFTINVVVFV